jgi:hypothetical protein
MPAERYLCKEKCDHCGKPVYADEGYHGISQNHYSCHDDQIRKLDECIAKLDGVLTDFGVKRKRKKVREGEGKIAQKCIKLATEAFERETGVKVTSALIWNQQGQYRGPHWDLAAWGIDFDFTLEGSDNILHGSIASWSTMTAVSKLKVMELSPSNMPYTYEF